MLLDINTTLLFILLAPLLGSLIAGLLGKQIGRQGAHWATILLVGVSLVLSVYVAKLVIMDGLSVNVNLFDWGVVDHIHFSVGFMVDRLTVFMMIVVNFVSLLVHIYSIGYMQDDDGYQRFFSYISGFTFAMLSLVMANNFLLLFFGWEAVGLVSYLLIGFWFKKESANYASLKAFIANRVGDLGFLLGLAGVLTYFGTLDYAQVFSMMPNFAGANQPSIHLIGHIYWQATTVICILLFIGAIGKSAQIPLHIWLEGSMEGPTPISALIHAATMVTAGVFMVARLSPMFEFSPAALSTVLIIGALTCFFMGLLGIVQNDIKRIIAYSTLSQLGYMMAAQGASAFSFGMFHLMTHAAFKALLFLAAGSVILGMHHEQDIRKMGGLAKKMPITYICMLIGALTLAAIPPFAGFYSKDLIIDAVSESTIPGHTFASWLLIGGAFVTALYTFRLFFVVFHGKSRIEGDHHPHESPWTVLVPLILLAIPSVLAGMLFFMPSLNNFFGSSIFVLPQYNVVAHFQAEYQSPWQFLLHGLTTLPFWLAIAGIVVSYVCYVAYPQLPAIFAQKFRWLYRLLQRKYWIDDTYDKVFGGGSRLIGNVLWHLGDVLIIDKGLVEGSAKITAKLGDWLRRLQTGYLYHYALAMIVGLLLLLAWFFIA